MSDLYTRFVSGALFLCVGVVYDRLHTREISAYGGLVSNMPKYAVAFLRNSRCLGNRRQRKSEAPGTPV